MAKVLDFIKLLRPWQWYKNILVFVPIVFVGGLFNVGWFLLSLLGFFALCAVSSANYIINDIADRKSDRQNPEKKNRPIASGGVKIWQAVVLLIILLGVAVWLAANLGMMFLYCLAAFFVVTQLYSFWLKKEVFADIVLIGINFVVRAVSGAFIINVAVSPWLIVGVFFFAVFLAVGKRHSELLFLGKTAINHRITLKHYTKELTSALMIVTTSVLIIAYSLYSFFSEHKLLFVTLPFALYAVFRYFQLVFSGSIIARHPERAFFDARMLVGMLLWATIVFCIIYFVG